MREWKRDRRLRQQDAVPLADVGDSTRSVYDLLRRLSVVVLGAFTRSVAGEGTAVGHRRRDDGHAAVQAKGQQLVEGAVLEQRVRRSERPGLYVRSRIEVAKPRSQALSTVAVASSWLTAR